MKAKILSLTALICCASILGMNLTAAYAASFDIVKEIKNNIQTEQLNHEVRDRNKTIMAISEHNKDSNHRHGR